MANKKSIEFRCGDDERLAYETAAKQAGLSLSSWIKRELAYNLPVRTSKMTNAEPVRTTPMQDMQQPSETATLADVRTNESAGKHGFIESPTDSIAPPVGKLKCNPAMQKFIAKQPPPIQQKVKIPDWLGSGLSDNKSDSRSEQVRSRLKG